MLPSGSTIIKLAGPVEERFPDLFFNGNLHFRIDGENMQVLGADHILDRSIRAVTDMNWFWMFPKAHGKLCLELR